MIKDTPEAVIRWADTVQDMISLLQSTKPSEGPTVCSWWIVHLFDAVVAYHKEDAAFGYHLARNLIVRLDKVANLNMTGWGNGPPVFPGLDDAINTAQEDEDG